MGILEMQFYGLVTRRIGDLSFVNWETTLETVVFKDTVFYVVERELTPTSCHVTSIVS